MDDLARNQIVAAPALNESDLPIIHLSADISNEEFLNSYARAGLIGLAGGETLIDKTISRAQRYLDDERQWSKWSHAFLFEGTRVDAKNWVIESDLDFSRKHIRLGVQENRLEKYFDEQYYTRLAILDFGLTETQTQRIISEALDLVAARTKYSIRELAGTYLGLRKDRLRERENLFSRSSSFFCSAFVGYLFRCAGMEIQPGLSEKHLTPEDIFRSLAPHQTWILERSPKEKPRAVSRIAARVKVRRKSSI